MCRKSDLNKQQKHVLPGWTPMCRKSDLNKQQQHVLPGQTPLCRKSGARLDSHVQEAQSEQNPCPARLDSHMQEVWSEHEARPDFLHMTVLAGHVQQVRHNQLKPLSYQIYNTYGKYP